MQFYTKGALLQAGLITKLDSLYTVDNNYLSRPDKTKFPRLIFNKNFDWDGRVKKVLANISSRLCS